MAWPRRTRWNQFLVTYGDEIETHRVYTNREVRDEDIDPIMEEIADGRSKVRYQSHYQDGIDLFPTSKKDWPDEDYIDHQRSKGHTWVWLDD